MSGINTSTSYNGPETNDVYSDQDTFETFDDLDDDTFQEPDQQQSATGGADFEEEEEEDEDSEETPAQKKAIKEAKAKKEAAKKARGQKGDDLDSLDTLDEEEDEEEEVEEDEEDEEEDSEETEEETEEKPEEKPEDKKAGKGKPSYITVDGETFAVDSGALISTPVDGKNVKVPLQELKNNYAGKMAWDKKFNEINLKEIAHKKNESVFTEKIKQFDDVKTKVEAIIKDPAKDPEEALKIFLDSLGVDSYDLIERSFKARLVELSNVLNMEPAERKSYFLEKKNSHLLEQQKKRDEKSAASERVNSYKAKVDSLRKSYGVSEAQYVDAREELLSYGTEEKDLNERDIVEWAATKPHRETVGTLLKPYRDQLVGDAYGELSWKLANILRAGEESADDIKKHLADVYGTPTEVKQLSKKLKSLGRKPATPPKPATSKKKTYDSFDDIDEE